MENRKRNVHLHVMVTPDELAAIHERMAEAGISNAGAYVRKMALSGYILHIDLAPVKELISLQRRCSNNLNQVAIHAHTYGVYPEEIDGLKRDYEKLWGEVAKVLWELSELVAKIRRGRQASVAWGLPPCSFLPLRAMLALLTKSRSAPPYQQKKTPSAENEPSHQTCRSFSASRYSGLERRSRLRCRSAAK